MEQATRNMEQATKATTDAWAGLAGKTLETMTLWTDVQQRVMREMLDLSVGMAKESIRLYGDLQRGALEAIRENHVKGATERAFRIVEDNAHAITQATGRFQATAEQVGRSIQETFADAVSKTQAIYTPGSN